MDWLTICDLSMVFICSELQTQSSSVALALYKTSICDWVPSAAQLQVEQIELMVCQALLLGDLAQSSGREFSTAGSPG